MKLEDELTEIFSTKTFYGPKDAAQAAIDVVERRLVCDEMAKIGTEVFVSDFDFRSIKASIKHVWQAVKEGGE